jgi:hypothetical protein
MAEPKVRTPQPTSPPRRDRGATFGWAIAGMVAVVAIVAVAFIATARAPQPDDNRITAAIEQSHEQGLTEGMARGAEADATAAAMVAEAVTDATTAKAEAAAREAQTTADHSALNVESAASDVSATEAAPIGPPKRR